MRQTGYLAAACLYALDQNMDRLQEDHLRARELAALLPRVPGVEIDPTTVDTNIAVFSVDDAVSVVRRLKERGIELLVIDERRLRAVTYMGIDSRRVSEAAELIRRALEER